MLFELIKPREPPATRAAAVAFLPRVPHHVVRQLHLLDEPPAAHGAAEGLFPRVDSRVSLQISLLAEPFATIGAGEGFLTSAAPLAFQAGARARTAALLPVFAVISVGFREVQGVVICIWFRML